MEVQVAYFPDPLQWQNQIFATIDFLLSVGDSPAILNPQLFQFKRYFIRSSDCEVQITQLRFLSKISNDSNFAPVILQKVH